MRNFSLEAVARNVRVQLVSRFSNQEKLLNGLVMKDYHGFSKARWPEELLNDALRWTGGLTPDDVQVEIVRVQTDLTHEVHHHKTAHAFVIILGAWSNLPNPIHAEGFIGGQWQSVGAGQEIDIPPGTAHGFRVNGDGDLWFLSVQSPQIERSDGHDDYYRVET